jgi:hypothetical protein
MFRYTGDLSQLSRELGKRIIEHFADRFENHILQHVRGEDDYVSCDSPASEGEAGAYGLLPALASSRVDCSLRYRFRRRE